MQSSKLVVAGIDEAGRGPLAGSVVACAAVFLPGHHILSLPKDLSLGRLRDSKRLSEKQREKYYSLFKKHPGVKWGIGRVSERIIDQINIHQATKLAMERSVQNLIHKLHYLHDRKDSAAGNNISLLIIDGNIAIDFPLPQRAVIHGDEKVAQCAAASIIAKVTRDRLMRTSHRLYPAYGFDRHKGYGTQFHRDILRKYGACPIHRKTFFPVSQMTNF